jgi:hypothetical protein
VKPVIPARTESHILLEPQQKRLPGALALPFWKGNIKMISRDPETSSG